MCSEAYDEMTSNPSSYQLSGEMDGYNPDHLQSGDPYGFFFYQIIL